MTNHSNPKLPKLASKIERAIYLWKANGEVSIIEEEYKEKLEFLSFNGSYYILYADNEDSREEFDIVDDSKDNDWVVDNLLVEQKLYMEYFKHIAELNPDGLKRAFDNLQDFFKKHNEEGMDESRKEVMDALESPEGLKNLEKLQSRIKSMTKTKVITIKEK